MLEAIRNLESLVIHSSRTAPSETFSLLELDAEHRAEGITSNDINSLSAYHLVVHQDGSLHAGRDISEPAALCGDLNDNAVAALMVGGRNEFGESDAASFTGDQFETLARLVVDLRKINPVIDVIGHRDLSPYAELECPDFDVPTFLALRGLRQ